MCLSQMKEGIDLKKLIVSLLLIGISIVLMTLFTHKEHPTSDSDQDISILQSLENTNTLHQDISHQLLGKNDAMSVIATSGNTIFCIYTDKQTDAYTNYLVISKFESKTNSFDILSYHNLNSGYENLVLPSEIKKLLDKQADITIEDNINSINNPN